MSQCTVVLRSLLAAEVFNGTADMVFDFGPILFSSFEIVVFCYVYLLRLL